MGGSTRCACTLNTFDIMDYGYLNAIPVHPTILIADAIDLLATKLRTSLQIQLHLTLALDVGYHAGEQPISADLVESVLSKQLNDLEPTLTRHGYRVKDLVEQFDARPAELKALFNNQLDPTRTAE
jgi:hypothetical protein